MALPLLALGALNMGLSAAKAAQQNKQRRAEMMARATETEMSPHTGRGPTTEVSSPAASVWADMAGGGLNAVGQYAALSNAGMFKSGAPEAPAPAMEGPMTQGQAQTNELANFQMDAQPKMSEQQTPWTLMSMAGTRRKNV